MRLRSLLATLTIAAGAMVPSAASAWTYGDTLTVILRPLPTLPALARPGDSFVVWANATRGASGWNASLQFGALSVPLAAAGGGWLANKGRWELTFTVPPGTPEETYALRLASDSTAVDVSLHAVRVLSAYQADYYFAQITDTHLPEHAFSTTAGVIDVSDTTGMADFDAVIEDLNVIHPEFILHTGDLVNEGELEEYLGMYEMGRAQGMLSRLEAPVWVSSGNHDIGGWIPTTPPDGNSRKNWWRYFGWKWLENPPAGDPFHSQDVTFDYGPLHVVGLEAYINSGSYDHYRQDIWGAQSFTPEQMTWLQNDLAAQAPGTHKLLYYHYDFGGTLPGNIPGAYFSQINVSALGVDGAIWGHNHVVVENSLTPRTAMPFNLGCRSVIDYRAFRIFRVHAGVISPGPMHFASTLTTKAVDSLGVAWAAANDGSVGANSVALLNKYGEAWDHARIRFVLANHDSSFIATGGTIAQVIRQGAVAYVYVDCNLPASTTSAVSVGTLAPVAGVVPAAPTAFAIRALGPSPFVAGAGVPLTVRFALPARTRVRVDVLDISGRSVALLMEEELTAGEHVVPWDGSTVGGAHASPGLYLVRLATHIGTLSRRLIVVR